MPSPTPLRDARHRAGLPTQRRAVGATNTSPCKQSSGTQQTAPSGKTAEYFGEGITASSFVFPAERTPRPYRACICEWDYGIALGSSAHLYVLLQKNNHKKKDFAVKEQIIQLPAGDTEQPAAPPGRPFFWGAAFRLLFPQNPYRKFSGRQVARKSLGCRARPGQGGALGCPQPPPQHPGEQAGSTAASPQGLASFYFPEGPPKEEAHRKGGFRGAGSKGARAKRDPNPKPTPTPTK